VGKSASSIDVAALAEIVDRWAEVEAELTAPGAPFAVEEATVRGERMLVYADRPRSMREILLNARRFGDRDGVIFSDGTRYTFAELADEVAAVGAALRSRGIGAGDRVAICGANSPGWLVSFWATAAIGAVTVAMNGWWTATEMRHALDLTEPSLLLGDTRRLERLPDPGVPVVDFDVDFEDLVAPHRGVTLPDAVIDEDDDAMLIFTSGTTGRPKAAVLTHRNVIAYIQSSNFIAARGMTLAGRPLDGPQPTRLAVFPLFHVSGLSATVSALWSGATTVWPLGRFDPATVIELTKQHGISGWSGTVTHVMRLLDDPAIDTLEPTQIMQVGIGGSASTPELIRRTEERFPHLKGTFSTGYGSTESGGLISFASNAMLAIAPDCVGPPLPTVQVRIVDEAGNPLPEGEEGNICARSPLVMKEYWRHPEATAETLLPGRWVKTGDFGRLEHGVLFIASRKRDLILRGGENVYPFEIENRIEEHADVDECAVIGVDHPTLGQDIKAIVVVHPGSALTPEAVRAWCASTLASYKVPAQVDIRTAPLPRNPTGKVMKHVLADESASIFVPD
jgi:acyl-CoA synthetase (AMP-forming)/AMP-acid ligase II